MRLAVTWLGHSVFLIDLPTGQRVLTDPWLGNPRNSERFRQLDALGQIDLMLVTHGHHDHFADVLSVARSSSCTVVCVAEIATYLARKGVKNVQGMNIGGTQMVGALQVTMTMATHSSGITGEGDIQHGGNAAGFVLRAADMPTIYFAGDTGLFGDMRTIGDVYRPEIAFLPIGDHYTMGPDTAAIAARWLGVRQVVPMHWGTLPVLTGTPDELRRHLAASGIDILELQPGETAR